MNKDILNYKLSCEANIVSALWKEPEFYNTYDYLQLNDFYYNEWKVYWIIGKEIYTKEDKQILDEVTVGLYLEKHPKLKKKYEEYGGYDTIEKAMAYVNVENLDGYVKELFKWNKVMELESKGYPIEPRIKQINDMSLEEVYNLFEAEINHIFSNVETEVKTYNLCEGLHELIKHCDEGNDVGFPINAPLVNDEVNGNMLGNITILGGLSGTGKTTLTIEFLFPTIIEHDEKLVMVINEQDILKIRKEMLTWVANNIYGGDFDKKRLRQGKFTEDELELLKMSADWLEEKKDRKNITIIPLQSYSVSILSKVIKKYTALGVKYFVLDTFKASDNAKGDTWQVMMDDMRKLYDLVKPVNKNVHLWATVQLKKGSISSRYLTTDNIGLSKNIIDVASTVLLMRAMREDEKENLQVFRFAGKNNKTKIPVRLDIDKHYIIIFIDKNREGTARRFQIVAELDLANNTYKEVGITVISEDF